MTLDLGQIEAQIIALALDDFNVSVLDLPNIAGSDKGVHHEANQPIHLNWHLVKSALDPHLAIGHPVGIHHRAQLLGLSQNRLVLAHREGASGMHLRRDLGERRNGF